ncbi:SDR family oxidoreductase [Marinibaculum pumilum]|uniref:SDR family oxidoreductase n=1 Tax=Marinibaculum pumilum TaxID=1766165 RepID=A0ABV7L0V5_9PROT
MRKGRVVLVTQVQHFVGEPAVKALLEAGAKVVAQDDAFGDAATRKAWEETHPGAIAVGDLEPGAIVAAAVAAAGRLDAVVSNDAYPAVKGAVDEADPEEFRRGIEAMMVRPFMLAGAAVRQMKAQAAEGAQETEGSQGGGSILFVTSASTVHGIPNYSMYVAARAGTNGLAVTLSKELARHGISVNALAPNFVESPTYFPPSLMADPKTRDKILSNIPLRRLGRPEEVAAAITFLVSGDSDFLTGQVIPIAGGWA